jgi:hypothetical protein
MFWKREGESKSMHTYYFFHRWKCFSLLGVVHTHQGQYEDMPEVLCETEIVCCFVSSCWRLVVLFAFVSLRVSANINYRVDGSSMTAALAHLGERQTEVHLSPAYHAISGGTVFDPQKRHLFCFCEQGLCTVVLEMVSVLARSLSFCSLDWLEITVSVEVIVHTGCWKAAHFRQW